MLSEVARGNDATVAEIGGRIYGTLTKARGSIGALVSSPQSDRLFAVTSAVVTGTEADASVLTEEGGKPIGRVLRLEPRSESSLLPAWSLLGMFKVDVPISGRSAMGRIGCGSVDDPLSSLGAAVLRVSAEPTRGLVTAVGVQIHLRAPGAVATHGFDGLIEVTSLPGSTFAAETAGGQAVYMESGELLGLIIGGFEERCFVVPINELLLRYDFMLADDLAIRNHNNRAALFPPPQERPENVEYTTPQLDGLNKFMRALSQTPVFYMSHRREA